MSFSFLGPGWRKEVGKMTEKCAWEVLDGSALCLVSLTLHFLRPTLSKRVNAQGLSLTCWRWAISENVDKKYIIDDHVRADHVGTQEGMYPAQPFSHLREFVVGCFCSYCLVVLNTLCWSRETATHCVESGKDLLKDKWSQTLGL